MCQPGFICAFYTCRILRPAPFAYHGMCELFEMFLLVTFNTFSEVSIADLLDEQLPQVFSSAHT